MMTYKQIANELGITEDEARDTAANAFKKIRKNMSQQQQEDWKDLITPIPEPTNEELDSILKEIEDSRLLYGEDLYTDDEDVTIAEEEGY